MASVAVPLFVAGSLVSATSTLAAGQAAEDAGRYEAQQLRRNAGNTRASSQRAASEEKRNERLAQSRLRAVAAASGASASDATMEDLTADIASEGEYRALSRLYEGESAAQGMEAQAEGAIYEGKAKKKASQLSAAGTLLSSGSTLLQKYGGGGVSGGGTTTQPGTWARTNYNVRVGKGGM